ncbi:MAG TPA: metallophosphoesterase [Gemmatimonadaceae bacterium]|jgi:predicted MPP superfamily phosphohydrolase|nr:metallophosphoesterase [Gemmatimonadaceae bacterium]HZJ00764.1 metallophosphoesterase [Gemmatimonadaceae bacterium]
MPTRRLFLKTAGSLIGAAAGLNVYAWGIEPHWLELVRRPLPIRNLPAPLIGRTLVQISDVHTGRVDDDYVIRTFDRVAALRPDIVVMTGDFISYTPRVFEDHVARVYPHFPKGRLATLGIPGNHDYGPGWNHPHIAKRVVEAVTPFGIRVLRNELVDVEGLQIVGLDDLWGGEFIPGKVLPRVDSTRASIVLSHNPDTVDLPVWTGYEGWILSGHTHGGQCKPPFLPPPILPVTNKRYTAGEFELSGRRRMYINRGVGHLLHVRFNVRPEVTVFGLQLAP